MSDTEIQTKKPKICTENEESISKPTEMAQATCGHFVKRKKRYCKMTVANGKQYCGEHEPAKKTDDEGAIDDGDRIPCPLDPKHTVYKKKLQKHLRICNARQSENEPAYVVRGINAGTKDDKDVAEDYSKLKLSELDDVEFYKVVEKVQQLYAQHVEGHIETLECQHKLLDAELAKAENGMEARKHLLQTSALLGILEQQQQLGDGVSFLEFGAGKGQLAFYLAQTLLEQENSQVVLLDRMSLRHKKDNKIEDKTLVHRIRVDIADFSINNLEILQRSQRLVAVSKHLCGGATDLALRCITQSLDENIKSTKTMPQTDFILIALCCHHRCDWQTFVGKEFFRCNDVSPRQFAVITKMVGWAICGSGMSRERRRALEEESLSGQTMVAMDVNQRLSLKERERIGFMCKRVLDHARLEYLRQRQFDATLKQYVSRDVTLENVCLLAKKLK